jgi:mRNA interferase MazF
MPPKPVYKRGDVILVLFPHADLHTAKLRPALIVPADGFHTRLHQVTVAMIKGLLFWPNHLGCVVEVVTGEALALFAETYALASAKVTFLLFLVRADGRNYSSRGIHRDDHPKLLL